VNREAAPLGVFCSIFIPPRIENGWGRVWARARFRLATGATREYGRAPPGDWTIQYRIVQSCTLRPVPWRTEPEGVALRVNEPAVVAEVEAEFARYEAALVANDVESLIRFFHDSPATVRFGIDDAQFGHEELAMFRRSQARATPPRVLRRTKITTFGADFAVADTEFVPHGSDAVGRQSQTWVRTPAGWRIVSAHVSWLGGRAP
jgi:hypothetical protein